MKKFTALAAALALCCGLLAGCSSASVVTKDSSAASGSAASDSASAAEERAPGLYVDGQAVEADPMLTIGGHPVSFDEYRYHYLTYLNAYGGRDAETWSGTDGQTNRDMLKMMVEQNLRAYYAFDELAAREGVSLTEDEQQVVTDAVDSLSEQMGGDESFDILLESQYMTRQVYTDLLMNNQLQGKLIRELYGDQIREEVAENYVHAQHILIQFASDAADSASGSDSAAAADHSDELARAEEILAKIEAGESFDDLMAEYNEDTGEPAEGYTFTTGEMVQEFEDAAFALEEGQVSGIVETSYGYHIIKRLPLDEEYVEENLPSMMGEETNSQLSDRLAAIADEMEVSYGEAYDEVSPDTLW